MRKKLHSELPLEQLKSFTEVLFIDDEERSDVIEYLSNEGWRCEQLFEKDFNAIDNVKIKHSHIICVDVNGVGKNLGKENEGLDVVVSIRNRFPEKKIILYSSERDHDSFHSAFQIADKIIPKNSGDNEVFCTSIIDLSKELFDWDSLTQSLYSKLKCDLPPDISIDVFSKKLDKLASKRKINIDVVLKIFGTTEKVANIIISIVSLFIQKGISV